MLNRVRHLALVFAIVASACSAQSTTRPRVARPELVVPSNAIDVVTGSSQAPGGIEVRYHVDMTYPADELLARIRASLPSEDWRPLSSQWMDATAKTSHATGWTTAIMATSSGDQLLLNWDGEWLDREGNFVRYSLRYDSPWVLTEPQAEHPANADLKVVAIWLPANTAAALQRAFRSSPGGQ